jgi:hypothetical protein
MCFFVFVSCVWAFGRFRFQIPEGTFSHFETIFNHPRRRLKKVDSYAGESDGAGATRVASVRLVVTDEAGAPVPRAAVAVMWSHEPTSGAPPDFSPTKKKVVKAKKAGEALLPPSPPASGPGITLRVVSVEAPSSSNGAPRKAWNRGASDVATQFTW